MAAVVGGARRRSADGTARLVVGPCDATRAVGAADEDGAGYSRTLDAVVGPSAVANDDQPTHRDHARAGRHYALALPGTPDPESEQSCSGAVVPQRPAW